MSANGPSCWLTQRNLRMSNLNTLEQRGKCLCLLERRYNYSWSSSHAFVQIDESPVDGNVFDRTALEQLQKEGVTLVWLPQWSCGSLRCGPKRCTLWLMFTLACSPVNLADGLRNLCCHELLTDYLLCTSKCCLTLNPWRCMAILCLAVSPERMLFTGQRWHHWRVEMYSWIWEVGLNRWWVIPPMYYHQAGQKVKLMLQRLWCAKSWQQKVAVSLQHNLHLMCIAWAAWMQQLKFLAGNW